MSIAGQMMAGNNASCSHQIPSMDRPVCSLKAFSARGSVNQNRISNQRIANSTAFGRTLRLRVQAGDVWAPPTVADTKRKFYETFKLPLPAVYNNVIQEFLVQHHLIRYNKNFVYDEIFALGFVSVFDQVLEGVPKGVDEVFTAYLGALDQDPKQYRADADRLGEWAKGLSSFADVKPDSNGDDVQKLLADIAERSKDSKFLYSKFFAIGLFRLLELTGAKDPQALGGLVKSMNVRQEAVNRDLMTYKGVLSKLSAAKELMKEFIEREKRKQAEREAEKAGKTSSETEKSTAVASEEKASA